MTLSSARLRSRAAQLRSRESHDRIRHTRDTIRVTRDRLRLNPEVSEHTEKTYQEQWRVATATRSLLESSHVAIVLQASALVAVSNDLIDLSDELVRMSQLRCPCH